MPRVVHDWLYIPAIAHDMFSYGVGLVTYHLSLIFGFTQLSTYVCVCVCVRDFQILCLLILFQLTAKRVLCLIMPFLHYSVRALQCIAFRCSTILYRLTRQRNYADVMPDLRGLGEVFFKLFRCCSLSDVARDKFSIVGGIVCARRAVYAEFVQSNLCSGI